MARDYCSINFAGLTHDHSLPRPAGGADELDDDGLCSAIAILKRHPMYDCLLLVKKYRNCLGGFSLEFPVDRVREAERLPTNESAHHQPNNNNNNNHHHHHHQHKRAEEAPARSGCARRRLVTRFLDGDDPMHRAAFMALRNSSSLSLASDNSAASSQPALGSAHQDEACATGPESCAAGEHTDEQLFMDQIDDRAEHCSVVHVPINGLLDRLESYTRNGVAVDGRVYAFAMGLKTAERMMTTKSMKELHETPI